MEIAGRDRVDVWDFKSRIYGDGWRNQWDETVLPFVFCGDIEFCTIVLSPYYSLINPSQCTMCDMLYVYMVPVVVYMHEKLLN